MVVVRIAHFGVNLAGAVVEFRQRHMQPVRATDVGPAFRDSARHPQLGAGQAFEAVVCATSYHLILFYVTSDIQKPVFVIIRRRAP